MHDDWNYIWKEHIDYQGSLSKQLCQIFLRLIETEKLIPGEQVPPERLLSRKMKVGFGTVRYSYERLKRMGLLEARHPKGTFVVKEITVKELSPDPLLNSPPYTYHDYKPHTSKASSNEIKFLSLGSEVPELKFVPARKFFNFYRAALKRAGKKTQDSYRYENILIEVSKLLRKRGISVAPECVQLLPPESALQMVANTLILAGEVVVMTSPADIQARDIFHRAGAEIMYTGYDQDGMLISRLSRICKRRQVKAVFIRPCAGYPGAEQLSEKRKEELLALSVEYHFAVITLDEDHEFWYGDAPQPMISRYHQGNVISITSINKLQSPLGTAGLVLGSSGFITALAKTLEIHKIAIDPIFVFALLRLIKEGEITEDIKKVIRHYGGKRRKLKVVFNRYLKLYADISIAPVGFCAWISFKESINETDLAKAVRQGGINTFHCFPPASSSDQISGLRIGFGSLEIEVWESVFKSISGILENSAAMNEKNKQSDEAAALATG